MMGDAAMVWSLEQIQFFEDKSLLSGHILVLLGHGFDAAQASASLSGGKGIVPDIFNPCNGSR